MLILNRPPINALDRYAMEELGEALEGIRTDGEIRVLVITGGIKGIFCSGGDLKYWRQFQNGEEVSEIGRRVFAQIEALPKPSIAAINGQAIGDGLALALACDLKYAALTATFRLPEVGYGFIPGWGLIRRLTASAGKTFASEFLLTAQTINASRAHAVGLVNEVFPAEQLTNEVFERSHAIAKLSPAALRAAKCALRGGDERACFDAVWNRTDWQEGIDAFLSKRKPIYRPDKGGDGCDHVGRVQAD